MLYQHKVTGGLVEKISQHGEGIFMVVNANDEVDYVHEELSNDSVSEGAIEHVGTIDLSEYFDDDLVELFRNGVIMGET